MGELISLVEYRNKKLNQEVDVMSKTLQDLIDSLDLDVTPKPYYNQHNTQIECCIDSLLYSSDCLLDMGYNEVSTSIDNIVIDFC